MPTYTLAPNVFAQYFDDDGDLLSGGKIYTYVTGTSTELATYTDSAGTVAHSNPIILDSGGRPTGGPIYLSPASYKFVLKTSADVTVATTDPVAATPSFAVDFDVTGTAGEALTAGNVVYISDGSGALTAGRWYKADADNTYSSSVASLIGMVPADISSAASGTIRILGRITGLSALTAGTKYFVSATAGAVTATEPTNSRFVGTADSATSIVLAPNPSSFGSGLDLLQIEALS